MAAPGTTYFPATGDPVVDGTTNGYKWVLNADRTLDWAIANGFAGEYWSAPDSVFAHAQAMLSMVSQYANIKFNYVGYYTTPSVAYSAGSEITLTLSGSTVAFPSSSYWARAFFPKALNQAEYYYGEAGDVVLNIRSAANNLPSYGPGSAGWALFLHELGHALGLKHPHDSGGTGRPTLAQLGLAFLDEDWASVMSYNDDFNWNLRQWEPATPMILDVLALQYLYGKNLATGAGASTYALSRLICMRRFGTRAARTM